MTKIIPTTLFQQNASNSNRKSKYSNEQLTFIGSGSSGGKAQGLAFINDILTSEFISGDFHGVHVGIPTMSVIRSDVFDAFMKRNDLFEIAFSDLPDERIAHAFQKASLPTEILGDLRALATRVDTPLAIRSSSILEDAMYEPFAGIYATKMIPNNQHSPDIRFQKLTEAIKFIYASTYFKSAKDYMEATHHRTEDEKMGVIIQEVMGQRHNDRFYPEISGVARSYNFYAMGRAKPEEGVVNLASGLGKTIVDGGISWTYSPAHPKISPPFGSTGELLKQTQTEFWAVNMGKPSAYDPVKETEYMLKANLLDAEEDGTLRYTASTLNVHSDRVSMGIGAKGPRILNFALLLDLNEIPLNDLIKSLLSICEKAVDAPVEIEFAMTFTPPRFGFLQVRPMVVSQEQIDISEMALTGENVLAASENVLGNGESETIRDIVYVKPENFDAKFTRKIVYELEAINKKLVAEKNPYLLIGLGRWGSSDPWLGIPVNWGQISGAKVIVEATLAHMNVEQSQGSHFFHNLTSFGVSYFSVPFTGKYQIDWNWLDGNNSVEETRFIRHVKLSSPLKVSVDGKNRWGVIIK
jgi:phosphoenolpyruvate synthase/pyruvate phosphate dikinase